MTVEVQIHRIGPVESLEDGGARRVELDGTPICVVRIAERVFAVHDRCTHQDIALSEGEVDVDDRTIECWKHGSTFSLETGVPQCLPATRPVATYPVTVEDGQVVVTLTSGEPA